MKGHPGVPVGEFVEEFLREPEFDEDGVQKSSGIGLDGKEYPDPMPMQPPIGYRAPPDILSMIRSMVQNERFMAELEKEGIETFEEADDFEVEDDPSPLTEYEKLFYPPTPSADLRDGTPQSAGSPPSVAGNAPMREGAEGAVASPPPVVKEEQHSKST